MKRRAFLIYSGLMGLGASLPWLPTMNLYAAPNYSGPLWLMIDATGGWDPTSLCDPKGYSSPTDPNRLNNYDRNNIQTITNSPITYAPPPEFKPADNFDLTQYYNASTFFTNYYQKLLVVNGIDTETLSHSDGARHTWSGELGKIGYPSFGALVAGLLANDQSMPYIANVGYTLSAGLTTPIRVNTNNLSVIFEIAYPNRSIKPTLDSSESYLSESALTAIQVARQQRMAALIDAQRLSRIKSAAAKYLAAHNNNTPLQNFAENINSIPELPASDFVINGNTNSTAYNLYRQGHIALAAYQSGVTASAHIGYGGFDTHANHDVNHYSRLMQLLQGVDAILTEAKARGLEDKIVVVMGSDFGRTNKYNDADGKDHWPITSMMFMGNSSQKITGNRVVGLTTADHQAINVDPVTLLPDLNDPPNPSSIRITPAHVHRALRQLAGVNTSSIDTKFGLKGQDINLFG